VRIAQTNLGFKVYPWRKHPIVAIAKAGSGEIAVATSMSKRAVELGAMGMDANEMTLELLAEP
jgi:isocitrate lyase